MGDRASEAVAATAIGRRGRLTALSPRLQGTEAEAIGELYRRHGKQIHNFCSYRLRNREEAEDATQLTFLNAFRGLRRGARVELESAWLYKIAENVCFNMQRSSFRRRRLEMPTDFAEIEHAIHSPERDADELLWLTSALETMPEQQRRAILLREWRGLSYKEIADELALSSSAVETLLFRARRSLADRLSDTPENEPRRSKLRGWCDLGSLAGAVQSIISAAGLKTAATIAAVAATTAVTASPTLRHHVADAATSLPLLRQSQQSHPDAQRPQLPVQLSERVQVSTAPSLPRSLGAGVPLDRPAADRGAVLPARVAGRSTHTVAKTSSPAAPTASGRASVAPAAQGTRAAAPVPPAPGVEATLPASVTAPHGSPQTVTPSGAAAAPNAPAPGSAATAPVPRQTSSVASESSAAHAAPSASSATAPPGQAKEATSGSASARSLAPGQVKREESDEADSGAAVVPPGQAKKAEGSASAGGSDTDSNAPSVPPGQAKKADGSSSGSGNASADHQVPPGQAKKEEAQAAAAAAADPLDRLVPPGQAKKDEAQTGAAAAEQEATVPPGQAKKEEPSAPVSSGGAASAAADAPGQAKKEAEASAAVVADPPAPSTGKGKKDEEAGAAPKPDKPEKPEKPEKGKGAAKP